MGLLKSSSAACRATSAMWRRTLSDAVCVWVKLGSGEGEVRGEGLSEVLESGVEDMMG